MSLQEEYQKIRKYSEDLCTPLKTEDYVPQPAEFVSPPKWHLGHTTWFFEEIILKPNTSNYKVFHKDFSYLFNSYYNTVGKRTLRADRGNLTRPSVEEVKKYRQYVDEQMMLFLSTKMKDEVAKLVLLGLKHEQQHQELLLTDVKFILGHNPLFPVYHDGSNLVNDKNEEHGWLAIDEGVYQVGYAGNDFYYDNEKEAHKTYIQAGEICKALVTNEEFMEFIKNGGYRNFNFWLDEGWQWVNQNNIASPLYWHHIDGQWYYYTLAGLKKVNPKAILSHVSYYEANAYATWKGMRLPTEFEWEVASKNLSWGKRWEWTGSAYLPYPNFKIPQGAVGEYNGKFMINQMTLRGTSVATSPQHSKATYRNFFHPHFQWQYSGIRLAK